MLVGRVKNGVPAVYIGYGHGLYVDVRESGLMVGPWHEADPSVSEFPLPTVQE